MLSNIRAERDGIWDLHLQTQACMLPYMFGANRINYARWLPIYILDMLQLSPDVQEEFRNGRFAIRLATGRFNGIWSDMAVEKTIVKDSKGDGGIIGITRKTPAVVRWTLTCHITGSDSAGMKEQCGLQGKKSEVHGQMMPASMKQDEKHVEDMICHINDHMTNPFTTDSKVLINVASGMHASSEVEASLLNIVTTGKQKLENFVDARLKEGGGKGSFYDPIAKTKLLTFEDMKKVNTRNRSTASSLSPEIIFRRALMISKIREGLSLENVLQYPIGEVPISMFHEDGMMRDTAKSKLGAILENHGDKITELPKGDPKSTVYIRDGMAVLQSMKPSTTDTFDKHASSYMSTMLKGFEKAHTVIDVFDRYDNEKSVKFQERAQRAAAAGSYKTYSVSGGRTMPNYKDFMAVSKNKESLVKHITNYIIQHGPKRVVKHKEWSLFVAGGGDNEEETFCITCIGVNKVEELFSTQEEADTRMLLHIVHADASFGLAKTKGTVILKATDTDVLVLAVYYFPQLKNTTHLWLETGTVTATTNQKRFVPVHEICSSISHLCALLPALHALTGCDSTSAFFNIGKTTMMNVVSKSDIDDLQNLVILGGTDTRVEAAVEVSRQFVAKLYDPKGKEKRNHQNLNKLRTKYAGSKTTSLAKLPPSEPAFTEHVKRVMWQTRIWVHSHIAKPQLGDPEDFGWQMEGGGLAPHFYDGPSAAEMIDQLICTKTCKGKRKCGEECSCFQAKMPCTEICPCSGDEGCHNVLTHMDEDSSDEE